MSKGFELASFEKLFANSIAFHAKGLRIYYYNTKLKRQLKKLRISARLSPNQGLSNLTTFPQL
jgi:hypothetical protein